MSSSFSKAPSGSTVVGTIHDPDQIIRIGTVRYMDGPVPWGKWRFFVTYIAWVTVPYMECLAYDCYSAPLPVGS